MSIPLSPATQQRLRDLVVSLSLGNLCVLWRWYDVERAQSVTLDYFRTRPPTTMLLLATLLGSAVFSVAFWILGLAVRRIGRPRLLTCARIGFLIVLIYPLETIRRYWNHQVGHADWGSNLALVAMDLVLVAGMVGVWRGHMRILQAAVRVTVLMAMFVPVFLIYFAGMHAEMETLEAYLERRPLPLLPSRPGSGGHAAPRVIWLLFDEFDERLAFDDRQPGVELPELDRLRSESFVGRRALQTAGWTMLAVPSLLSGRIFGHSETAAASTLLVQPPGSQALVSWRDEPNVFRRSRDLGVNAALIGWYHPYCRVLGDSLTRCYDEVGGMATDSVIRENYATESGFWKSFVRLFPPPSWTRLTGSGVTDPTMDKYMQARQQREYFQIRDRAYEQATDPRIDFLYVHFPTPHLFAIYDHERKDFTLSEHTTYFDNLALVDRTVGELRKKLEQAGMWDSTTILVTADHGLRYELWHGGMNWSPQLDRLLEHGQSATVPFILKLGGQTTPAVYDEEFSSVVTGDVSLAVLRGDISRADQVAPWLEGNANPSHMTAKR